MNLSLHMAIFTETTSLQVRSWPPDLQSNTWPKFLETPFFFSQFLANNESFYFTFGGRWSYRDWFTEHASSNSICSTRLSPAFHKGSSVRYGVCPINNQSSWTVHDLENFKIPCQHIARTGCFLDNLVKDSRAAPDVALPGQSYPASWFPCHGRSEKNTLFLIGCGVVFSE